MGRLDGKVAIITGAAGGQGEAEAKLFAQEGAKVVATDINEDLLNEAVKNLNDELGSESVLGLKHDVASEEDWDEIVSKTVEEFGKIDILVNNAGIGGDTGKDIWDFDTEYARQVIDINLFGNLFGIKKVVPEMKKNGSGSIINISSIAGIVGGFSADNIAYTASKGASRAFTKDLALDLANDGIRVNSVHPGVVQTPMTGDTDAEFMKEIESTIPVGFVADSEDLAHGVLYLASDESRFVTGSELVIDGGSTA